MMKAETAEMIVLLSDPLLRFWLRSGADLEATDSLRRLPIHVACEAWFTILLVQLKHEALPCYAMLVFRLGFAKRAFRNIHWIHLDTSGF